MDAATWLNRLIHRKPLSNLARFRFGILVRSCHDASPDAGLAVFLFLDVEVARLDTAGEGTAPGPKGRVDLTSHRVADGGQGATLPFEIDGLTEGVALFVVKLDEHAGRHRFRELCGHRSRGLLPRVGWSGDQPQLAGRATSPLHRNQPTT